jgi:NitT/TauT family transport system substrate-binding protein
MVGRTDKDIYNISDIVAKRIGVAIGTNAQFYLGRFLDLNFINQSQIAIVNVPFDQSVNAIVDGTVDAIATVQPYVYQIQNSLSNQTITWSIQANQPYYFDLISKKDWVNAHPELIVRFLKALTEAEDFSNNNQNQAIAIVASKLNNTESYVTEVWSSYVFTVSLDQAQLLAMQDEARWLINNNLTNATSVPNFLDYVYIDGLATVRSSSVTIIR